MKICANKFELNLTRASDFEPGKFRRSKNATVAGKTFSQNMAQVLFKPVANLMYQKLRELFCLMPYVMTMNEKAFF